ncbi:MAG: L,D-transpeptidase family protein [Nocardioides sp.]|uniref:L,D-transpeptidase family protein n=1 Tax=Nocardioides sp. TaxID=35761 RepID=UPI0039E6981A
MRALLVLVVAALVAALCPPAPGEASTDSVTLGGVRVRLGAGTTQVVTVNRSHGFHARVSLWVLADGRWARRLTTTDGRIGYAGLTDPDTRVEGSGTTPLGTYDLTSSFGTHRRAASWDVAYHRIRGGDYWVGDNRSAYYNRLRAKSAGGFRWWIPAGADDSSEHLVHYRSQYEYAFVTSFNAAQVRRRGFAIFLHVNGRGATAGCVSVPQAVMRRLFRALTPAGHPVIAIGR